VLELLASPSGDDRVRKKEGGGEEGKEEEGQEETEGGSREGKGERELTTERIHLGANRLPSLRLQQK
jgi:hypothetical protein